jgi:hypothetical protein
LSSALKLPEKVALPPRWSAPAVPFCEQFKGIVIAEMKSPDQAPTKQVCAKVAAFAGNGRGRRGDEPSDCVPATDIDGPFDDPHGDARAQPIEHR